MSHADPRPLYQQLAAVLRDQIRAGELAPGARLPTEAVLSQTYDASRNTVRDAIDVLRREGLVESRQGRGAWVRQSRLAVVRKLPERYRWEKERARNDEGVRATTGATEHDTGLKVDDLVFTSTYDSSGATDELAELFGVPAGTQLLRRSYTTRYRDERAPLGVSQSYLVYAAVAGNPDLLDANNEPWPGGTLHQLSTVGIEVDHIVDEVSARPPSAEEMTALGLPEGTPVIATRKTSFDIHGRVVEVSDIVQAGDRAKIRFTSQLNRWET
ncbi:GntR family transcriptional regulator [Pilimelia anulata]|uniref:GntR family transcriptional regulator n=1 Tax=Pilimelia anulata TaxID=53371 RepID=UPI00166AC3AF|nr:GntR family transcriptional regulator [Pilimelia anulata]